MFVKGRNPCKIHFCVPDFVANFSLKIYLVLKQNILKIVFKKFAKKFFFCKKVFLRKKYVFANIYSACNFSGKGFNN